VDGLRPGGRQELPGPVETTGRRRRASPRQRPGLGVAVAEERPQHGPEHLAPLGHVPRPRRRWPGGCSSTAASLQFPAEAGWRRAAHFRRLVCRTQSRRVAADGMRSLPSLELLAPRMCFAVPETWDSCCGCCGELACGLS
jgi:hypothetical protein